MDVDIEKNRGILWKAARRENIEMTRLLKQGGADPNAKSSAGQTALMVALSYGNIGVAKELVAKGADVTLGDHDGNTPLHLAVRAQSYEIAELLIARGANVNARNIGVRRRSAWYSLQVREGL